MSKYYLLIVWSASIITLSTMLVAFFISKIRRVHPYHVQVIWFCFSLSFVVTLLLLVLAYNTGAVDKQGDYQDNFGMIVRYFVSFNSELKDEFIAISSLLALLVLSQIMTYTLSGMSGCASNIFLLSRGFSIWIWFVVKGTSSTSGFFAAAGLMVEFFWKPGLGDFPILLYADLAVMLIFVSFASIFFYYHFPKVLPKWTHEVHEWATRFR